MTGNLVAKASTTVNASRATVWKALVDPAAVKQYMFGTTVVSDWKEGSPIVWKGEWKGKKYEDKGVILAIEPGRMLRYTHFSPLGGLPDAPEPEIEQRGEDERDDGCGGCPDRDPACDGAREAHARTLPASSVCPHTGRPVISDGCAGKPAHPEVGTASGA